ncbi:hypothetical protein [Amycolatopsis sp. NPDC050768]|uniref:hypothetical protein n=1 Tax=Amycolatopsis sp. NPDC050768 TaxID=3154839 RepID=UPI0033C6678A
MDGSRARAGELVARNHFETPFDIPGQEQAHARPGNAAVAALSQCELLGLFDRLDELVANDDFRCCLYFAGDIALEDPDYPARVETEGSAGGLVSA